MTFYKNFVHRTVKHIRDQGIKTPIFMGGPYPTGAYEDVLKDEGVDICVLGEGETTLTELLSKMIENENKLPDEEALKLIAGMAFNSEEKISIVKSKNTHAELTI